VGDFDGGGVCKLTVLLGAGVLALADTVGGGVGGFVVGRVVGGFVGKGVGKGVGDVVLSPGHGGHTDTSGEGGGVEVSGTSGQLDPSHGGEGGGVTMSGTSGQSVPTHGVGASVGSFPDGEGVTPPGVNGTTGASVLTGFMELQIVGDGDWVEVVSKPSFLLPGVGTGGQVHKVGSGVTSVPRPRLEDGTHFSLLELGLGLLVLHAGIAAAEGLAELGAMEGELVPFMIPGTAVNGAFVGFVTGGSEGKGVEMVVITSSLYVGVYVGVVGGRVACAGVSG